MYCGPWAKQSFVLPGGSAWHSSLTAGRGEHPFLLLMARCWEVLLLSNIPEIHIIFKYLNCHREPNNFQS